MSELITTYKHMIQAIQKICDAHGTYEKVEGKYYQQTKLADKDSGIIFSNNYKFRVYHLDDNTRTYIVEENGQKIIELTRFFKKESENMVTRHLTQEEAHKKLEKIWNQHMEGYQIEK